MPNLLASREPRGRTDFAGRQEGGPSALEGDAAKPDTLADSGEPASVRRGHGTRKKHIRGSMLLLLGRLFSMVVNFAVQVLTVRYLAKSDYGAFAYAHALVALGTMLGVFSLDKAVGRFVPIYHERREYQRMWGAIFLACGTILGLGLALAVLVFAFQGLITRSLGADPLAVSLLLVMIALAPVDALDRLLGGLMAIFAKPRAIFLRRHVLGPGLKLAAVLAVMLLAGNVYMLAASYLVGGLLGVVTYSVMLVQVLREQGLLQHLKLATLQLPAAELFSFSTPLLSSDLVLLLRGGVVVFLLEFFHAAADVAEYRAVVPIAGLNKVVVDAFQLLFMPLAARLFARNDRQGINDLYWTTAIWITVLSFPIFVVTFSLAQPVTVLLLGTRYEGSSAILAILSLAYFFNAALGFNALTLRVFGKVRWIVTNDLVSAAAALILCLVLIPRYAALGGAIATCTTLVLHNILNQIALAFGTGVRLFRWRCLGLYLGVVGGTAGLLVLQAVFALPLYFGLVIAAIGSLTMLWLNRSLLDMENMFPELLRMPLVRRLLA
jgi:O-antigen/teichoic acid export membrane protein